jgi:lipopolysaccharide biosynthesis glycosyltransferase
MRDRVDLNTVKFFCVSDINYLEPTYVTLSSYFKYNTHEVTLYVADVADEQLTRFKKFNNLKIEQLETIDMPRRDDYEYYHNNVNFISAKIYILDSIKDKYKYALCFDTDTIFTGNIEEVFDDLDTEAELQGIDEEWPAQHWSRFEYRTVPYLNVGFLITKLGYTENLLDNYLKFLTSDKNIMFPEQDFLNDHFKKRTTISDKYNLLVCFRDLPKHDDVRFMHFCSPVKPFRMAGTADLFSMIARFTETFIPTFDLYYDYIKTLDVSDEFRAKCEVINKQLNVFRHIRRRIKNDTKS